MNLNYSLNESYILHRGATLQLYSFNMLPKIISAPYFVKPALLAELDRITNNILAVSFEQYKANNKVFEGFLTL